MKKARRHFGGSFLCLPLLHSIQPIGPPLHHVAADVRVFGVIVGGTDSVAFNMGKLTFDDIDWPTVFVEGHAGHAPEPVGQLILIVAKTSQNDINRHVAHGDA